MLSRVGRAIRSCAKYSLSIFLTFAISATVGGAMAHGGNRFALSRRDAIVQHAVANDKASIDYASGRRVRAALTDAAANFGLSALPQTIGGLAVVLPYFTTAYQGWVGGIVSVDSLHRSRLRTARGAAYYLGVLALQFLAFSLCIGGGVQFGLALYAENGKTDWRFWRYRVRRSTFGDLVCVVGSSIPLFLIASFFEFLVPWNT